MEGEDSFLHSVAKINNGTFGLEVHIILVTHRSPAAQAHWETNRFLLYLFYKKMKPRVSFLKAFFDLLLKIIVCFPDCPMVSLVFAYLVWDHVTEKKNGHIKLIYRSWVSGSTVFLVDNHSRWIPFFQRKEGCILPCQITLSLLVK